MEIKKKILTAKITKGEGDKKGLFLFVISDGLMDRHGESVNPNGWDFSEFNDNSVALVGHDYGTLPVGKWLPPVIEGDQVKSYLDIADTERGKEARYLIENDYLKTVSVGFRVEKWGGNGDSHTIMQQKLYEVSLVSIPANTRAQRVKDAKALEMFENLDKNMNKKEVVTMPVEQLKELILESVKEAVSGLKVVEEKTVEKIVYVEGKQLSEKSLQLLLEIKKSATKAENKSNHTATLLNSILNIKNSTEGGVTK